MVVVSAGRMRRDGKTLIARRPEGKRMGGLWELPGGKREAGEDPRATLERELREELGVVTRTGRLFDCVYENTERGESLVLFFDTELVSGEPKPLDGQTLCWAEPDDLDGYEFSPADRVALDRLRADI